MLRETLGWNGATNMATYNARLFVGSKSLSRYSSAGF